jgi:hypothetical protein
MPPQFTLTSLATMLPKILPVLIDAAMKGAVLLAAAGLLTLFLRRGSAAQRHLVWLLALGGSLALPVFSALLPAWRILPHWPGEIAAPTVESSAIEPTPAPQAIPDRAPTEPNGLAEMHRHTMVDDIRQMPDGGDVLHILWTPITDAGLAHLEGLTELQELTVQPAQVTDAGLAHLEPLTKLQLLKLSSTKITRIGHLKGLRELKTLFLGSTNITDAGLENLKDLPQIRALDLSGTHVTEEGVKKLQRALPNCKIVAEGNEPKTSPTPEKRTGEAPASGSFGVGAVVFMDAPEIPAGTIFLPVYQELASPEILKAFADKNHSARQPGLSGLS